MQLIVGKLCSRINVLVQNTKSFSVSRMSVKSNKIMTRLLAELQWREKSDIKGVRLKFDGEDETVQSVVSGVALAE